MKNIAFRLVMMGIGVWRVFVFIVICIFYRPLKQWLIGHFNRVDLNIVDTFNKSDSNGNGVHSMVKARPTDIQVHNEKFYSRLLQDASLGFGEAYMDGWWDCDRLDETFRMLLKGGLYKNLLCPWNHFTNYLQFNLFNLQTAERAFQVGKEHYDLGNTLFESFLDPTMNYSCAYWKDAKNLHEAQQNKMELIGRKLKLKPGMRVLDMGCGWGGLSKYLAETYKVQMVACTVSAEQAKLGRERCKGLPVDIRCVDYRDVNEKFDRVVSVGLMEHVGRKNYRAFFKQVHSMLSDEGIFVLHTIGIDNDFVPAIEPWFNTYIFPNGILPYHTHIAQNADNLFTIEDWHNIGSDYDKTLMAWYENFVNNWPTIRHLYKDPVRFYRMWTYYLLISAGGFRSRKYQLWQVVLAKNGGVPGGYISVR